MSVKLEHVSEHKQKIGISSAVVCTCSLPWVEGVGVWRLCPLINLQEKEHSCCRNWFPVFCITNLHKTLISWLYNKESGVKLLCMKTNLGSTGYTNILAFSGILILRSKEQSKKNTLTDIIGQSYKNLEKIKINSISCSPHTHKPVISQQQEATSWSVFSYKFSQLPQFSLYKSIFTTPSLLLVISKLENGCQGNLLHRFPRDCSGADIPLILPMLHSCPSAI